MANSDKNILITPNVSAATGVYPNIKFNGANNTPVTLSVLDDGTVSFSGTAGQLFSVSDGLSGTIFSVNDISGIPSIEVVDTGLIKLNQYNGQTIINGSAFVTNSNNNKASLAIIPRNQVSPALIIKSAPETAVTITGASGSGSTVTYNAVNSFSYGQYVTITGVNPSAYNLSTQMVQSATSTQFTVSNSATGTYVSGGTATTVGQHSLNPIFEIQNSSGSSIFSVDTAANNPSVSAFQFKANYFGAADATVAFGLFGGSLSLYGNTPSAAKMIVKGAASQTADLQQWQNSSGTVLASINASGQLELNGKDVEIMNIMGAY